jgi:hypothetical protein
VSIHDTRLLDFFRVAKDNRIGPRAEAASTTSPADEFVGDATDLAHQVSPLIVIVYERAGYFRRANTLILSAVHRRIIVPARVGAGLLILHASPVFSPCSR